MNILVAMSVNVAEKDMKKIERTIGRPITTEYNEKLNKLLFLIQPEGAQTNYSWICNSLFSVFFLQINTLLSQGESFSFQDSRRKVGMLVSKEGKQAYFSILSSSIYFPLESADSSLFLLLSKGCVYHA